MPGKIANSVVAAFDFDCTLTGRDSLLPFLYYARGRGRAIAHLSTLGGHALSFFFGRLSRQEMKEKILSRFLGGCPITEVEAMGARYARDRLDRWVRRKALQRLRWHLDQGHRCLLVSASLSFYLEPWAKVHGFEAVLCSQLEVDGDGRVTGRLKGLNCWGEEKRRRLLDYLGPRGHYQLYAYGDSRGDREMLDMADHPFYRVFDE